MRAPRTLESIRDSFDEFYTPEPNSGCWLWLRAFEPGAYGKIQIKGKCVGAHRMSWQVHKGPIPEGKLVLHKCDVRLCVNPDHLFLGSYFDNTMDAITKGRWSNLPNVNPDSDLCPNGHKYDVIEVRKNGK